MKQTIKRFLALAAVLSVFTSAYAQITTSSMNGIIKGTDGEPLTGAAVVAVHTPSGTQYYAVANAEGRYSIQGMRPGGPYEVTVSFVGCKTNVYQNITLALAESYAQNAVLENSESLDEVYVIADAKSKFSQEKTGAATNITNEQISGIPTVSRSISDVTRLSPYGGNGMSFAGSDGRNANFTVDGANFNNNFGLSSNLPGGGNPISIDAIEEMQVVISPFDIRQTNFIGGGVNAITKSGTNTLKGTAYTYHRNENMRGDSICGEQISGARATDRNTTYGLTLGGPIIKNKLFFFVNAEYSRTPTVANRWRGSVDGVSDADNYISKAKLSDLRKVSDYVMEKYGYDTGSYEDFPADESNMKVLARIDWNINEKHKLALRYNYTLNNSWSAPNGSSMDGGVRSSTSRTSKNGMSYANSMYSIQNLVHTVSLDLNSRLSDKVHNEFLATYSKLDDIRGTGSSEFPFIDILDGSDNYISLGYELFTYHNAVHNTVANVKDDITVYAGEHKITGGLSFEYQMADNAYMRNGTGYYRYSSLDDFLTGATPEVVCLTYGYNGETDPAARVQFYKPGLYGQDEWSVNENLKLTAGLRLDGLFFNNGDLMTNNAILAFDYTDAAGNVRNIDTGTWPTSKLTVSPRIGFNWDALGDRSLKVRGGSGLFSGRLPLVFFTNMPTNSNMVQYKGIYNATGSNSGTKTDMSIFQGGLVTDSEGHATIAALRDFLISHGLGPESISPQDGVAGSAINAVDPDFKMPQVWKTSLAFDYAFNTSFPMSVSVEGIFNKTVNAVCISDWSIKDVAGFARFNGVDNRPLYQDYKYTYTTSSGTTCNMPSAFVLSNTSKGYGWSADITFNITPVKGLNFMAAYTHTVSKELTGMPGSDASSAFTYIPTVDGPNWGKLHNSQYVTPDRVIASLDYRDNSNNRYSLIYEAYRGGYNYSYMTTNDINGDGYNYDVIYIPTDSQVENGEFRFVSVDDQTRFMNFVHRDRYLSRHQGEYAEAYSVYSPWTHKVDFSYKHDFKVNVGDSVNTLQLSLDVKNLLNLFNSSWGVAKYFNPEISSSARILKYEGVDADGYATFSTPSSITADVETFVPYHAVGQCWYASVGIKYMFN